MSKEDIQKLKSIRYLRKNKNKKIDYIVLKLFKKVFLRWCSNHLTVAKNYGVLNDKQYYNLDSQMKGDLGFPGYTRLNKK